jgi:hypothetical protein
MYLMRFLTIGVLLVISGCSAQWHLNKAVKKDPSLVQKEVVSVVDTVIVPGVEVHDTLVFSDIDTVEIVKDNFHVKLVRVRDSIFIDGGCKTDTLIRTVSIPIEKVVYKGKDTWFDKVKLGSFYVIVVIILAALVRKMVKRIL